MVVLTPTQTEFGGLDRLFVCFGTIRDLAICYSTQVPALEREFYLEAVTRGRGYAFFVGKINFFSEIQIGFLTRRYLYRAH